MSKEKIKEYIDISKSLVNKIIVIVVGNAKEITRVDCDFTDGTSIVSEYYALQKFNYIVETLKDAGFETLSYFDEMDFIHDYLTQRIRNNYYKPFVVLNFAQKGIVHGRKSLIPVFCEMNNIIHTNSDPFVCSLVREKYIWYKLLEGIAPVCNTRLYDPQMGWIANPPSAGKKVIAKLENQCSSIGLDTSNVFSYSYQSDSYIHELAQRYSSRVVVQEFIEGYEVEFPFCYDGREVYCLRPQGIKIDGEQYIGEKILAYETRKNHEYEFYNFDEFNPELSARICYSVEQIAKVMNMQGMGRIDCRIKSNGDYYFTDVNSNPHLIEIASPAEALRQIGLKEYSNLLHLLIGITITRHPNQIKL